MKILWLSHFVPYPPKGGALQRTHHLLRGCSEYHDIHVLAFDQEGWNREPGEAESALGEFVKSLAIFPIPADRSKALSLALAGSSLLRKNSITSLWLRSREFRAAVNSALQRVRPDLIYLDTISLAHFVPESNELPVVLNHHNIESHMMARRKSANPLLRAIYRLEASKLKAEEVRYGERFDLHITCSDLDSERLAEYVKPGKVLTIPNAVDTAYFDYVGRGNEGANFLFVGGLSWYPNAEAARYLVSEIWPHLRQAIPEATLTIVGRNPPDWLSRQAQSDTRLKITGFVDDVRPYFQSARVFLCPIQDGGGTKLKVLDCLASGTPLIAHEIACEGIDVADGVNVLFANTAEEYVSNSLKLMDDVGLAQRMSESGRALIVSEYSAEAITRKLAMAMKELAK